MEYADLPGFNTEALLSTEAEVLSPETLEGEAELAIDLLGLREYDASDAQDLAIARRAIALQVNHQVKLDSGAAFAVTSETRGRRSETYRQAGLRVISPIAANLVYGLLGPDIWPTVKRRR